MDEPALKTSVGGSTYSWKRGRDMVNNRKWRAAEYLRNKDKYKVRSRAYQAANKEKVAKATRMYRIRKRVGKVDADTLTDRYVSHLLCYGTGLSRTDIPPQLIEAKRAEMQIKRKLKDSKLWQNQKT